MFAKKSQKLNEEIIQIMCQDALSKCPSPQVHLLLLGDNNLRHGKESVDSFITKCNQIVSKFSSISNCHLILSALIPSPETDAFSKFIFSEANQKLKYICQKNQNVSYLNLTKIFVINGVIDMELFCGYNDVHLNSRGAKKLAKLIYAHVIHCELKLSF